MLAYSTLVFLFGGFLQVAVSQNEFGVKVTTEKQRVKNSTQYLFQYYIKDEATGDYKTQEETRNGDSVRGTYSLADPNGDLRTVTYKAGPGKGFEAKVNIQSKSTINSTAGDLSSTTAGWKRQTEPEQATDSKVNRFPGGFAMNILRKPHLNIKRSEMRMKFSMTLNNATATSARPLDNNNTAATSRQRSNSTGSTSENTTQTILKDFLNSRIIKVEKTTLPAIERETTEDFIEKQIDEVINSMPKLPELIFSDNKSHFKFYKDPEEASIDERISQIARQLAETNMRREYEEQKLGHVIPISVKPIEPSPATVFSKSLKFNPQPKASYFRPTHFPDNFPFPVPVQITAVKIIPEYVYRDTFIPNIPLAPNRWSLEPSTTSEPKNIPEKLTANNTYEVPTAANASKSKEEETNKISKSNENVLTTMPQPFAIVPLQIPTFLRFFSPVDRYLLPITDKQEPQLYISHMLKDSTAGPLPPNDDFLYSHISAVDNINTSKS